MSYSYADWKFSFGKATTEGIMLMYEYMSNITATICPYSNLRKIGSQARYYKVYESAFAINLKCNIIFFRLHHIDFISPTDNTDTKDSGH